MGNGKAYSLEIIQQRNENQLNSGDAPFLKGRADEVPSDRHFPAQKVRTTMDGKETRSISEPDPKNLEKAHPGRRTILGVLTAACFGVGVWLYGFAIIGKVPEPPATAERKDAMLLTEKNSATTSKIPPIDASAPAKTETATFALG